MRKPELTHRRGMFGQPIQKFIQQPSPVMQRGAQPMSPEQAAMARQMVQSQPKKKGGMFSGGGKGWDALAMISGTLRDLDGTMGRQNYAQALQGIQGRRAQDEAKAKQAQQQAAMEQMLQGMTPEQRMAYRANPDAFGKAYSESLFGETQTPQYFKSGDDIISIGPDGQSRVAYDAPEGPMDAGLPQGMEIDPETGRPRFMPEYIDGQRAIAEARGGNGQNVQSVQVLQNGEIAIIRRDGTFQQTGQFAKNPFQISDVGGVPTVIDRLSGTASQIATPEQVGGNKAIIQTVVDNEADRRSAEKDLPKLQQEATLAVKTVKQLLEHPGFADRYGWSSLGGKVPALPEGDAADAQAIIDQLKGQTFLQAYEKLKGGGVITEIEGDKAQAALNRAFDQNQSTEAAIKALEEFVYYTELGLEMAQKKAQGAYAPQSQGAKPLVFDPATGELE